MRSNIYRLGMILPVVGVVAVVVVLLVVGEQGVVAAMLM